ncbi:MAG: hypothetical protein ABJC24_00400 [Chloroflexota bacterium]
MIVNVRQHYGNEAGLFGPELRFAGNNKDFSFDCPGLDTTSPAVLLFQTRDVDNERNFFNINGRDIPGGIPVSAERDDWNANVAIVGAGWLKDRSNVLQIGARNDQGGLLGDIDDFLINNVVHSSAGARGRRGAGHDHDLNADPMGEGGDAFCHSEF